MSEDLEIFDFLSLNQKRKPIFTLSACGYELASDLDEQLDLLLEQGILSIDLKSAWGKDILDMSNDDLKRIEKALKARGMTVSSISTTIGKSSITDPFEPDLEKFERALEIADWVGSSYIRIYSYKIPEGEHATYRAEVAKRFTAMVELTLPWGLIILVENDTGDYGDTAERFNDIVYEVGSGNIRIAFNYDNSLKIGEKPNSEAYPQIESQLTYIRIGDTTLTANDPANEVEDFINTNWEKGYQGFIVADLSAETGEGNTGLSKKERFVKGVEALKALIEKAKQEA